MPKYKHTTHRGQSVKVKTAKGRKISSTIWLQRQLNDPYAIRAKKEGYASRAAYKLLEIEDKFHILGKNKIILDLGAAPGSWCQVAMKTKPKKIIAVDIIQMHDIDGVTFIRGDFTDEAILGKIQSVLSAMTDEDSVSKADVILSDMAPNTSGHRDLDHLKIIDLGEHVLEFAKKALAKDGALVMKTFQGGGEKALAEKLKQSFFKVKFFKPQASRKDSSEIFLVSIGLKIAC